MKELPYNEEIYYQDYDLLISSGREGGMHRPLMQQIESYKFSMFLVKNREPRFAFGSRKKTCV